MIDVGLHLKKYSKTNIFIYPSVCLNFLLTFFTYFHMQYCLFEHLVSISLFVPTMLDRLSSRVYIPGGVFLCILHTRNFVLKNKPRETLYELF